MNKNKKFVIQLYLTPSIKEGVLFLYWVLNVFYLSVAQPNHLYLLQMSLNDSVKLQLPVKLQTNQMIIPAYSAAIQYTSDIISKRDSMFTSVSIYENKFFLRKKTQEIEGIWIKYSGDKKYEIPCIFKSINTPVLSDTAMMKHFPPQWKIKMISANTSYDAVGTFQYKKDLFVPHLSGSIATPYGDLGNMNGVIKNDSLYLYAFNGAFVNALTAKIFYTHNNIDSITGYIYYGNWGMERIAGVPDPSFHLNNQIPIENIFHNPEFILSHQWKDIDGNIVQLQNNKPALILFMGSWCPNCADEVKLFTQWYDSLFQKIQIMAFAVERTNDETKARLLLQKYKQKLNIPFPIILLSAKGNVPPFNYFPEIIKIPAFPTSVYFNKSHQPYIATIGFNGPATHQLYIQSQEHIKKIIQKIIQ